MAMVDDDPRVYVCNIRMDATKTDILLVCSYVVFGNAVMWTVSCYVQPNGLVRGGGEGGGDFAQSRMCARTWPRWGCCLASASSCAERTETDQFLRSTARRFSPLPRGMRQGKAIQIHCRFMLREVMGVDAISMQV